MSSAGRRLLGLARWEWIALLLILLVALGFRLARFGKMRICLDHHGRFEP